MWARFSEVAAVNPYAWSPRTRTAEELRTIGPANRMVAFPYPKLFNANDRVDQGAALILCSVEAARSAGVPEDRWVFPLSGADASDHWFLSHRHDLHSSPAIRLAGAGALRLAGVGVDDIAHLDLYSCFPCAVQIAAHELGIAVDDPDRPLTVTGGLGFAGGPGNNYVSHAIAVGNHKSLPAQICLQPLHSAAGQRVSAGINQMQRPVFNDAAGTMQLTAGRPQRHIAAESGAIQKIAFDLVAFVTERDEEFPVSVAGVVLEDVPQDWPAANFHHRLGLQLRFFREARAHSTGQYRDV